MLSVSWRFLGNENQPKRLRFHRENPLFRLRNCRLRDSPPQPASARRTRPASAAVVPFSDFSWPFEPVSEPFLPILSVPCREKAIFNVFSGKNRPKRPRNDLKRLCQSLFRHLPAP